jgi:hypothetical protein
MIFCATWTARASIFHLQFTHQILSALLAMDPAKGAEFETVIAQLEFGGPADLTVLMAAPFSLTRGECLALAACGIAASACRWSMSTA